MSFFKQLRHGSKPKYWNKGLKQKCKETIEELKYDFNPIYKGIVDKDNVQIVLSSIDRDAKPNAVMSANLDGFQVYCKEYAEYHKWLKSRNLQRFVENASNENNYDRKNMMHCHRLLDMCIEILSGKGVKVLRPNAQELLAIRNGNRTYNDLLEEANKKAEIISELYKSSSLPAQCDTKMMNDLLLQFRKEFYAIEK